MQLQRSKRKTKHDGFFINKGELETDGGAGDEEVVELSLIHI